MFASHFSTVAFVCYERQGLSILPTNAVASHRSILLRHTHRLNRLSSFSETTASLAIGQASHGRLNGCFEGGRQAGHVQVTDFLL